jgi:hypothetical protein
MLLQGKAYFDMKRTHLGANLQFFGKRMEIGGTLYLAFDFSSCEFLGMSSRYACSTGTGDLTKSCIDDSAIHSHRL